MQRRNVLLGLSSALSVAALSGCASSAIVVGQARAPIDPSQVKIYIRPPKKYQEIAVLESSSKASFSVTAQGKTDVMIRRLREEAARLGANGVLLQGTGSEVVGSAGVGTGVAIPIGSTVVGSGTNASMGVFHRTGNGLAIFVEEE